MTLVKFTSNHWVFNSQHLKHVSPKDDNSAKRMKVRIASCGEWRLSALHPIKREVQRDGQVYHSPTHARSGLCIRAVVGVITVRIKEGDALLHLTMYCSIEFDGTWWQVHQDVSAPPGTVLWEAGQNWKSIAWHVVALVFFQCSSGLASRSFGPRWDGIAVHPIFIHISYIVRRKSHTTTSRNT